VLAGASSAVRTRARPRDRYVPTQAVEGLLLHRVVAVSSFRSQPPEATVGPREATHRNREAVSNGHERVLVNLAVKASLQALFHFPKVRGLPTEGGTMHLEKLREKPRVMAAEVGKNTAVGVLGEEFADQFTGQHHAVNAN